MRSFRFTDDAGHEWDVIDFKFAGDFKRKKRLPVGDRGADGRAFVPIGRDGPVMLHEFGTIAYRDLKPRTLPPAGRGSEAGRDEMKACSSSALFSSSPLHLSFRAAHPAI